MKIDGGCHCGYMSRKSIPKRSGYAIARIARPYRVPPFAPVSPRHGTPLA